MVLKAIAIPLGVTYDEIMKIAGYLDTYSSSDKLNKMIIHEDLTEQEINEVLNFIDYLCYKRK